MPTSGVCRLCERPSDLQDSHILPAFVFRWLRETSATGFIRLAHNPNQRAQDGLKLPMLCAQCEGRLNRWETSFANKVFHPYVADSSVRVGCGKWLLKFCTSISWRVLMVAHMQGKLGGHFSARQEAFADSALSTWRRFLLDLVPHPGQFEQHLIAFDAIKGVSTLGLPPNLNRYLLRGIEMDWACAPDSAFVLSKMGPFVVLGFIDMDSSEWKGTRVKVNGARIEPHSITLPHRFGVFLGNRAEKYDKVYDSLSPRQKEKIDKALQADPGRFFRSGTAAALQHDIDTFGQAAFAPDPGSPERKS